MFGTKREPESRRSNKVYGNAKAIRSSRLSLLSVITAPTEGSGGSSSTITQESYLRSINRASHGRRRKTRHRHHRSSTATAIHDRSVKVNVFDFMVKDQNLKDELEAERGGIEEDAEDTIDEEDVIQDKPEDFYRHISDFRVADSTYGSLSGSVNEQKTPSLPEEPHSRPLSSSSYHGQSADLVRFDPQWSWHTSSPVAAPIQYPIEGYIPPPCPPPPPAVPGYDVPHYYSEVYPGLQAPPPQRSANYELAFDIRKLKGTENKPQYFRSFISLSTQLLLQMQDDITELESELEAFDAEAERTSWTDSRGTCDRRNHPRRAELCQDLHLKLDQYYQALAAQNKVEATSRPVSSTELDTYRQWLQTRITPTSRVSRLIKKDIRIFDQSPNPSNPTITTDFLALAFGTSVYALLPLLSFRLVTNILTRLSVLTLFAISGFVVQDRIGMASGQVERACFMAFILVSTMAAIVL